DAIKLVLEKLRPHLGSGPCVALVNNLGSTTPLEMSVLCHGLAEAGVATHIVGPAPMMTSLDMHGFSVSVMSATDAELDALALPVPMPAWPAIQLLTTPTVTALPDGLAISEPVASSDDNARAMLSHVADVLIGAEAKLNALDAKSGDGDTGSTLATAARALKGSLDKMPLADASQLFRALGNELSQTMGGSSGVILAIYFNATGDACSNGALMADA
ncbi:unnamed protein product, partial [Ectocarpus sp. 12 AP-2014]